MRLVVHCRSMAAFDRDAFPTRESVERHVFAPLSAADEILRREFDETAAEHAAFERFGDRVRAIDAVSNRTPTAPDRALAVDTRAHRMKRVRRAFRETVMSIPHYDDVYDESLRAHAASELSVELAAGLDPDADTSFTPSVKRALLAATHDAIDQRDVYRSVLDDERESLASGRESLTALLESLEAPPVVAHRQAEFTAAIDAVARRRQETLRTRKPLVRQDGHDLCPHLYRDREWTYPLLTAVTRFRKSADA